MDTFWEALIDIVNSETAGALSLSRGGWEGWLQCELWLGLMNRDVVVEREVAYPHPNGNRRCDLVVDHRNWVELKAFGVFREGDEDRFLDSFAVDVAKLEDRPVGTTGTAVLVVPNAVGANIANAIRRRGWLGLRQGHGEFVTVMWISL